MKVSKISCLRLRVAAIAASSLLLGGAPAYAVHDTGTFELDGNALQSGDPGDDWQTLYNGGGSQTTFSGIVGDVIQDQIFTGGKSKTIYDVSQWKHKSASPGSPPDKDNITHAYAANYVVSGEQVIYFGTDLYAENGDAEVAAWFFQNEVTQDSGGSFSGTHEDGDVYVAAKFSNGGTESTIAVYEWWFACDGAAQNPGVGDCAADNIRVVQLPTQATCGSTSDDDACAISNANPTSSPWPYTPKNGTPDTFPATTFFEGGINISQLFGGAKCFASFMVTTGASTSFNSTSKDYALGSFDVCSIAASKTCLNDSEADDSPNAISYNIRGCAINSGAADVKVTTLENSIGGAAKYIPLDLNWYVPGMVDDGGGLRTFNPATDCDDADLLEQAITNGSSTTPAATSLAPGEALVYQFSETTASNGPSDTVTIDAEGTDGSAIDDTDASATCPLRTFNAALSVTKQCAADLEDGGDNVIVRIDVEGQVCNTGEVALTGVSLADDPDMPTGVTVTLIPDSTTLAPAGEDGDCTGYTGYYYPDSIPDGGDACPFADQVTATAIAPINSTGEGCTLLGDGTSECSADSNTATCYLRAVDDDNNCSTGPLSTLPE